MNAAPVLFHADHAHVARYGGGTLFESLNWTIREGEIWAIVGPNSSGKTTLAEVILRKYRTVSGTLAWPTIPADEIRRVSFKEESRLFSYSNHYYQQRYNFIEADDDLSLFDYLTTQRSASAADVSDVLGNVGLSGVDPALSLLKLSNGQMRRARLARAFLARPRWLILDEPFMGLDDVGRFELADLLVQRHREGMQLLLITRPDSMPSWVTHCLRLDQGNVIEAGPISSSANTILTTATPPLNPPLTVGPPIVEMRQVNITAGGKPILRGIDWTIRQGERWALLGPNGSGKTTLLSLLAGDHPQVYANDVTLFGRRRGTGESIWEVKKRIGLVSPEFHLYFSEPLTAFEAASTGYHDTLVLRPISAEQEAQLHQWFDDFGLKPLEKQRFSRLSTGLQRLVLFLRALVKRPALLILDEPFQGLDMSTIERARRWLDTELEPTQTLIFVTHYADELPVCIHRRLRLDQGQIVECG